MDKKLRWLNHFPNLWWGIAIGLLAVLLNAGVPVQAQEQPPQENKAVIYMFWGDGCPHCAEAKPYLEGLAQRYPWVELRFYEVWYDEDNRVLFEKMAAAYGFEARYVPTIFIGTQHWVGYNKSINPDIEKVIMECRELGCPDAGAGVIFPAQPTPSAPQPTAAAQPQAETLTLPLIGTVDLSRQSLAVSTALIAFVDGFNPCSVWVLTMLLALTLHTGSRRKVVIIGVVFLTVTAAVYALFIAGLFTIFTFISFVGWIRVVVALVALFFAAVNIKDYFFYKEGLSFTIADEKKPGIARGIRRVMDASQSLWGLIGATIALAAGVSLVEFSCTAGFPVLWSNLLVANQVEPLTFVVLLLLYMLIYQIDELAIFFVAVFTLKASRLEEKHGRILKLIGGVLMLTLAVVMVLNPNLLDELNTALIVFAAAFAVTGLILLVHRRILPRFGIWIGTEAHPRRRHTGRKSQASQPEK
uniref:Thioredoxin domain-containing protein n=1 Tax=Bellilinea caldifistulae TaxID=360411 RepID=A0A7C4KYI6_9CHLR